MHRVLVPLAVFQLICLSQSYAQPADVVDVVAPVDGAAKAERGRVKVLVLGQTGAEFDVGAYETITTVIQLPEGEEFETSSAFLNRDFHLRVTRGRFFVQPVAGVTPGTQRSVTLTSTMGTMTFRVTALDGPDEALAFAHVVTPTSPQVIGALEQDLATGQARIADCERARAKLDAEYERDKADLERAQARFEQREVEREREHHDALAGLRAEHERRLRALAERHRQAEARVTAEIAAVRAESDRLRAEASELREQITAERSAGREREAAAQALAERRQLLDMVKQHRTSIELVPSAEPHVPGQCGIWAHIDSGRHADGRRILGFQLKNCTVDEFELDRIEVTVDGQTRAPVDIVWTNSSERRPDGVIAIVPPRSEIEGSALVPDGVEGELNRLSLRFTGVKAGVPVVASAQTIDYYTELRSVRLEREARERRSKQAFVLVQARYGAYQMRTGISGNEDYDFTSTWAVGAYLGKGFAEVLALEFEFLAGRTGIGRHSDVDWDGMEGRVERSASFGRVGFGAQGRFGDMISPTGRLIVGVQGTSYTSTFTTDGMSMDGPGGGSDLLFYLRVSFGLDVRIGDSFLIGTEASMMKLDKGEATLDLGAHVGVAF
ncbi:hypothetical protein [Haliangium sp.]|uniref:hypothetical protein n=1 Tax=Haliangium sp. TaxID=2663208 RepID=UPI003D12FAE4